MLQEGRPDDLDVLDGRLVVVGPNLPLSAVADVPRPSVLALEDSRCAREPLLPAHWDTASELVHDVRVGVAADLAQKEESLKVDGRGDVGVEAVRT